MHIWDDVKGYFTFEYADYAFRPDPNGEWKSIYGKKLTKVFDFSKHELGLHETDVPEITRTLVDLYTDSDIPSNGHIVLTFDIEIEMISGMPDTEKALNEITSIALHNSSDDSSYVLILDKNGVVRKRESENVNIFPFTTEKELLQKFLSIYESIHPTILTGWNIDFFDIPYLYNRIKNILGEKTAKRLSPIQEMFFSPYRKRWFIGGVSSLDYLTLYQKYNYKELDNYRLDTVAKIELGRGKVEYTGNLDELMRDDIEKFIDYNLEDVKLIVDMDKKLQFIELVRGICHAGHICYEDHVFSGRIMEGALLCFLRQRGLVSTNKPVKVESDDVDNDEKFIGAYVKDPIVGKYDWVYDLDLTSLYPSIIMSLNISPETKIFKIENWHADKYIKDDNIEYTILDSIVTKQQLAEVMNENNYSIASNGVVYTLDKKGCIPAILEEWFQKRVEYRKLEKKYGDEGDSEKYAFYKKRQLVQKILLNSLYGVLGLQSFRFYDIDNAEAVTTTGQTVIKKTADVVNIKYNKELNTKNIDYNIYIDTDSVFFSSTPILDYRYPDWKTKTDNEIALLVDEIAGETQNFLNRFYDVLSKKAFNINTHRFEIKKEFVAKAGFWVAKKRYAQWIIAENGVSVDRLDVKGLDVVRSSFPQSFKQFMKQTLIEILQGKSKEIIDANIIEFKNSLSSVKFYDIAKSSSVKELSKYTPNKGAMFQFKKGTPAHVKAAWTYNQLLKYFKCGFKFSPIKNGDKIKWIYIRQNPLGIETIGFKGADDPIEIEDFIKTYVDYDKIFESEMQNKLEDFYTALRWGKLQVKITKSNEFFSF